MDKDMGEVTFEASSEQVVRTVNYITINGKKFNLYEVQEVIEGLEDTTYGFNVILIDNYELGELLDELGVAFKGTRGSFSRGENYKLFKSKLEKFVNGHE